MKNITQLYVVLLTISLKLYSQEDIKLDLLKAPASPSANLLNMSPEQISHVSDVNALMTQLGKQTTNFTQLPKSFAIDFAPRWMLNKRVNTNNFVQKSYLFGKTKDNRTKDNFTTIPQTLVFSFAYQDSTDVTSDFSPRPSRLAMGFRFSIVRGELKTPNKKIEAYIESYKALEDEEKVSYNALKDNSKQMSVQLSNSQEASRVLALEKQIKNLLVSRQGYFWDFAGGNVWDAYYKPSAEIKNSRWALWSTFGYEWNKDEVGEDLAETSYSSFSIMGMARIQQSRDSLIYNRTSDKFSKSCDFGLKLGFAQALPRSITANFEFLRREVIENKTFDNSWRLAFSADYEVSANMKLTLSLGRDFAGVITKEGNLFGLLGFAAGLGSRRKIE